jgi:hypothetical protein
MHFVQQHRQMPLVRAFLALVPSACADFAFFLAPRTGLTGWPPWVEMIKAEQVDVYGIQVIRADQY